MTLILKTCFIKTLLGEVWASLMLCQRLYTDICYDLNPGLRNLVQDHYNLYNFRVIMSQIWPKGKKIFAPDKVLYGTEGLTSMDNDHDRALKSQNVLIFTNF